MSTTWILVSNASIGRLFRHTGPNKKLELMHEFTHQQSREKNANLVSDRPGHNPGAGNGYGALVSGTLPKEHEADVFALELARQLEAGRVKNLYSRLVLVASPAFLGKIKQHLNEKVSKLITDSLEKDYTRSSDEELSSHLSACVCI